MFLVRSSTEANAPALNAGMPYRPVTRLATASPVCERTEVAGLPTVAGSRHRPLRRPSKTGMERRAKARPQQDPTLLFSDGEVFLGHE